MASTATVSPEGSLPSSSYDWPSPRSSLSRELSDGDTPPPEETEARDCADFEFQLDESVAMLSADELFSDGMLVPLQPAALQSAPAAPTESVNADGVRSPEPPKSRRKAEISGCDPHVLSPKVPRCSSRWRELLGLKRCKPDPKSPGGSGLTAAAATKNPGTRSLKRFLHRNPRSAASDSSLSLPLLRDSDCEPVSASSRGSLSSSSASSGPDHDDLARMSLDSDKAAPIPAARAPLRVRLTQPQRDPVPSRTRRSPVLAAPAPARGASVDSPRMNSSGKVVFQGLERSSSSPGSFHGGPRPRPRGMERSYSANIRVASVLNMPVYSLRCPARSASVFGLGPLFSQHRKERGAGPASPASCDRTGSKGKTDKPQSTSRD